MALDLSDLAPNPAKGGKLDLSDLAPQAPSNFDELVPGGSPENALQEMAPDRGIPTRLGLMNLTTNTEHAAEEVKKAGFEVAQGEAPYDLRIRSKENGKWYRLDPSGWQGFGEAARDVGDVLGGASNLGAQAAGHVGGFVGGTAAGGPVGGVAGSVGGGMLGSGLEEGIRTGLIGPMFGYKPKAADVGAGALREAAYAGAGEVGGLVAKPVLKAVAKGLQVPFKLESKIAAKAYGAMRGTIDKATGVEAQRPVTEEIIRLGLDLDPEPVPTGRIFKERLPGVSPEVPPSVPPEVKPAAPRPYEAPDFKQKSKEFLDRMSKEPDLEKRADIAEEFEAYRKTSGSGQRMEPPTPPTPKVSPKPSPATEGRIFEEHRPKFSLDDIRNVRADTWARNPELVKKAEEALGPDYGKVLSTARSRSMETFTKVLGSALGEATRDPAKRAALEAVAKRLEALGEITIKSKTLRPEKLGNAARLAVMGGPWWWLVPGGHKILASTRLAFFAGKVMEKGPSWLVSKIDKAPAAVRPHLKGVLKALRTGGHHSYQATLSIALKNPEVRAYLEGLAGSS